VSGKFCLDANAFITAWHVQYPPRIFASLWEQLAGFRDDFILIKPVFDEIDPIPSSDRKLQKTTKAEKYPLRSWLEDHQFEEIKIDDATNNLSIELEKEYEISEVSSGAGQTDITLIAYAKIMNKAVVTFEKDQHQKPAKKSNYKIPLICREQGVTWIGFIEMLDKLGVRL
jgi:hypothetical protein